MNFSHFTEERDSTVSPLRANCDYGEILLVARKIAFKDSHGVNLASVLPMPGRNVLFKPNESYL